MISATGMSISKSDKLVDGLLETNVDPGGNDEDVSTFPPRPSANSGEFVGASMAGQTRGSEDFQTET